MKHIWWVRCSKCHVRLSRIFVGAFGWKKFISVHGMAANSLRICDWTMHFARERVCLARPPSHSCLFPNSDRIFKRNLFLGQLWLQRTMLRLWLRNMDSRISGEIDVYGQNDESLPWNRLRGGLAYDICSVINIFMKLFGSSSSCISSLCTKLEVARYTTWYMDNNLVGGCDWETPSRFWQRPAHSQF